MDKISDNIKVKTALAIIVLAIIGVKYYVTEPLERIEVQVVKVIDGDTIVAEFEDGSQEKVRFIGVNAPEEGEDGYEEALDYTTELLYGKTVWLESDKEDKDQYGRLLRYVWIEDLNKNYKDKTINGLLVRENLAEESWIKPNVKHINNK